MIIITTKLREIKSQAYWEILNNISDISNSTRIENIETEINIEDDDTVININKCDENRESNNLEESDKESDDCDIESEENNENNFEESNGRESDIDETIKAEEENIENIPNFILYNSESDQTTVIDIRPVSVNCNTLQFPDTAYAEFRDAIRMKFYNP
ncbi:unnamed protein product [Rhizophagus irregularis]|nr:unnamed protein product [Rhizophagus irregularis]